MKTLSMLALLFISSGFALAITPEEAGTMIETTFKDAKLETTKHYCVDNTMTCRSMYTFKDLESFRISFYSSERQVAASEYYIKAPEEGMFYRFVDTTFDGKLNIFRADEIQQVIKEGSKITIKKLYMPRLGTTRYIESDLIFDETKASLDGFEKDSNDVNFIQPLKVDYLRMYLTPDITI